MDFIKPNHTKRRKITSFEDIINNYNNIMSNYNNNNNNNAIMNNNLDLRNLPIAESLDLFLESPNFYRPKIEFINALYSEDDTVLTFAIRQQNFDVVRGLLAAGGDANLANRKGVTPISVAAHKGNIVIMRLLIDYGANVNSLNNSGSTALIQASHFGNIEAVRLLLDNHAMADFANSKGTTALMRASQEGHVEISKLLIQSEADVNRKNNEGMNALMLASQRGHADMVSLLIKSGASMDEQTAQGSTALMLACKRDHEKCVEVLITMGAEIHIRDCRLRTAKDTALRRNHMQLIYWLNTQVQVARMQDYRRRQRSYLLNEMRQAYITDKLRIQNSELQLLNDLESLVQSGNLTNGYAVAKTINMFKENDVNITMNNLTIVKSIAFDEPWPNALKKPNSGYFDWEWSKLLYRIMGLPLGLFECIVDYIPSPRIWQWSLYRLRSRCKLAPSVSINDIGIIIDEILCDSRIFNFNKQKDLLIFINRNQHLHKYLVHTYGMTQTMVDTLSTWADIQSLASRTTHLDLVFKPKLARDMLAVAIQLYKWYRNLTNSTKIVENLLLTQELSKISIIEETKKQLNCDLDDNDLLEATDIGGEDASDTDNLLDQETENEMAVESDDRRFDDDSDIDVTEFNSMQLLGMQNFGL
mmetsp:Transcript_25237/g.22962  ORF Transcript_25237/g.22962 Transcript_25237/m.22962 type:complete len:645 (+) Transcript_25237:70-2004(+)